MKRLLILFLALTLLPLIEAAENSSDRGTPQCSSPEHHQFDFWAGDWDVYDRDNPKVRSAHVRVDRILGGCVLHETYEDPTGHHGESFSIYDAARKVWHQTWVTNRGELLVIEGKFESGAMNLNGTDYAKNVEVRGTWKQEDGGVRETAYYVSDAGRTRKLWFDLMFRPHHATDAETILQLDRDYQAAVAKNDVDGMDRMLADNFIVSTSKGQAFSKVDLLAEARGGKIHYDRQDDGDQTVRVYGDAAVITAKLFAEGTEDGKPFEYTVWFSDLYTRTSSGWKYVFGQAAGRQP
jgi:ketosteroid isomerase-like protein